MFASADQRVLGYLGRALSLEMSAVQLYSTQAQLLGAWGLAEPAARMKAEAAEEQGHADRIIGRMLSLNVAPNASQLRPVRLGGNLQALLLHDLAFEQELIHLYDEATRYCASQGDHDNRLFFEALLGEEQAHARELTEWIRTLEHTEATRAPSRGATF